MTIQGNTLLSKIRVNHRPKGIFPALPGCSELLIPIDHAFILESPLFLWTKDPKCALGEDLAQLSTDQCSSQDSSLLRRCILLHSSHYTKHNQVQNEIFSSTHNKILESPKNTDFHCCFNHIP